LGRLKRAGIWSLTGACRTQAGMSYITKWYLFILVLSVRLSRWRGNARLLSGLLGISLVQFLLLLTLWIWIQIAFGNRFNSSEIALAIVPVLLYGANARIVRNKQYEALERKFCALSRWMRLLLLAAFVAISILILIFFIRSLSTFQSDFHIGAYERG
jgi:hypothetical protein